ncbi:hypothetical protein CSIV_09210 [Microbacterium sp. CSI-V]|uniref:hypothetical protein n=1 Tax=unclassified Microbacterium TaxID=2609290 RepID=UPI00097C3B87|nr:MULTISPECIES: hypothetical protein [unclassified Microbacterium]MXS75793.1 hypothetical protein [Microbacterium sp. TL13]ONI64879.1 hypothetical protein CSIV_09210 [Microbacterium sp. CSI-V]
MTYVLELIRTPVAVCVLLAVIGVGLGLGYDAHRRVAAVIPIVAAMAAGLLVGAMAPEVSLATPTLALGFVLTILVRGARSRRLTEHADADG